MNAQSSNQAMRSTRQRVRIADNAARIIITVGGLGVIAAVLGILVFLVIEAGPLFLSGRAAGLQFNKTDAPRAPLGLFADEYLGRAALVDASGSVSIVDLQSGDIVAKPGALASQPPSAISELTESGALAFGFQDGTVQLGSLRFASEVLTGSDVPGDLPPSAEPGRRIGRPDGSYLEVTPERQWRHTALRAEFGPPTPLPQGVGAVRLLDYRVSTSTQYLAALRADGSAVFNRVSITRPLGGGKPRTTLVSEMIRYKPPVDPASPPDRLYVTNDGDSVLMLWLGGFFQRYARVDGSDGLVLVEQKSLIPSGRRITQCRMLIGSLTLILGLDDGTTLGAFVARANTPETRDGRLLVVAHEFPGQDASASISALATGLRDRSFLAGDSAGRLVLRHMASHKVIATMSVDASDSIVAAAVGPKNDGVVAISKGGRLALWRLDPGHPEASTRSLFGRVWYEGDAAPSFVYQSSAGEDSAEAKLSLVPLIFGTLKATIYAMLFAVPVAILAAIYTSELLHPRRRALVKPLIEMMASLPSVVLGFVAAMVIAPYARDILPSILIAFGVVPFILLLSSYLWQLLPIRMTSRIKTWQHLALVLAVVAVAWCTSLVMGPVVERILFTPSSSDTLVLAGSFEVVPRDQWPESLRSRGNVGSADARSLRNDGLYARNGVLVRPTGSTADPAIRAVIDKDHLDSPDIRRWLDGSIGSPWPGWFLLMVPTGMILTVLFRIRLVDPLLASLPIYKARRSAAIAELCRFALTVIIGLVAALSLAATLSTLGLDARDSVFGAFDQRNTLVVALVMGFAIIPIIYTISEDSLSAVPGSLRSASLGCGASRWQTAVRVVLPVALSGIFSACMIGLGRAAGETMIVLMSTGNTPAMDWNIFSGFRTLAANIATEMPEAAVGSTHYRVLFLSALCLFGLTFIVNTLAELVRQRVRRKGAGL